LLDKALYDAIYNASGEGWPHVNRFIFDLQGRLRDELEYTYVFAMRGGGERLFEDVLFGVVVADRFSDATFDISEARKCLALGRYTASVFHSMRVLELGLQSLAHELLPNNKWDDKNWGKILRDIEDAIGKMERDPLWTATPNWREQRESFAQASAQFSAFRDAWRNHVAHNRRTYTSEQAEDVFRAVKAFMQSLAPWLEQPEVG
jgi:HEPN domain-containing protein